MIKRWLVLAGPVVSAVLLGQLACGDDDGGGTPGGQTDAGSKPDATLDSGTPETSIPEAGQDAGQTDATPDTGPIDSGPDANVCSAPAQTCTSDADCGGAPKRCLFAGDGMQHCFVTDDVTRTCATQVNTRKLPFHCQSDDAGAPDRAACVPTACPVLQDPSYFQDRSCN
jgi:hypothetical protein